MLQMVVENLPFPEAEFIFLIRKEHAAQYDIENMLKVITDDRCKVVLVDGLTEGAACTALLAKEYIDNDEELLIANSDQLMEYSIDNFNLLRKWTLAEALVFCFTASDPKWSFVKTDSGGKVIEVAEKKPISNIATCGVYWYRHGSDFVKYAEQMIDKNIRVKNEFYIAPVYNELIEDKVLLPFFVDKMYGLGTPEDVTDYLSR